MPPLTPGDSLLGESAGELFSPESHIVMMQPRPSDLPNFRNPPVNEVVLGVQFSEIKGFSSVHAGLFWGRIRGEFARFEEHGTLPETFELFGGLSGRDKSTPSFELLNSPPVPRYWFINDDTRLLQVQQNKLFQNWRKTGPNVTYPHYEDICRDFQSSVAKFEGFLRDEDLGELNCNQCEVSYINHIPVEPDEGYARAIDRVFGEWLNVSASHEAIPEEMTFNLIYRLGPPSAPVGRLRVEMRCAYLQDETPILALNLTARGQPFQSDKGGYLGFMSYARDVIVWRFTKITSERMHHAWGRFQ